MIEGLQGKVVIVTGGGHGIGTAYCEGFTKSGSRVVVADIDGEAAEKVAGDLAKLSEAGSMAVHVDVSDEESTKQMVAKTIERFGRVDVLIKQRVDLRHRSHESRPHRGDHPRGMGQAHMRQQKSGKIVNVASGTALSGPPGRIHYVASKAGVMGFSRTLAREVGDDNIQVNILCPGSTLSEVNPTEEVLKMRQSNITQRAIKRVQVPQDLVGGVLFMSSPLADFMTGQTLVVDGGQNMH
ncbi:3-oxoacyl-[acyl-carrier-protein] reductase FabG [Geodia barretti]|uniref:3-oxoacyl-[acyl-carrier-protein] reductase FabG n=1 Tax=Geodia barretti TaxID=519541 RepID=A0AA35QS26_GEOBA|nr:3-oxoacyl-[acyl-carrier-protein] reductase FabG [Geodia barretti]